MLYLPREKGGRGLRSLEYECKSVKVKSAIKLYGNEDPTMQMVRKFEEHAEHIGHQSLVKDAKNYAEELGFTLQLNFPEPTCENNESQVFTTAKYVKVQIKEALDVQHWGVVRNDK